MKVAGTSLAIVTFLALVVAIGVTGAGLIEAFEMLLNQGGEAYELNLDPNSNLIISDYGAAEVWQVNPATDVYTIYYGASSAADARADSAGNIWWTNIDFSSIARFSIADNTVTEWMLESSQFLYGLAVDEQDRVYVSDTFDQAFWRLDVASSELCTYTINTRSDYIAYENNQLWLGDWANGRITRYNTQSDSYRRWLLPSTNTFPGGMDLDDQGNLWWADPGLDLLSSLDPASNVLTDYEMPVGSTPQMITFGNGGIWYTEQLSGTAGLLDPAVASGITTTLAVSDWSTTPVCGPLGPGSSFQSFKTTDTASWTGVTLDILVDDGGWKIYALPAGSLPWGITTLRGTTYIVDQDRRRLVAIGETVTGSTITLIKDPTNDDGGNALPDDFDLSVGDVIVSSGVPYTVTANTAYSIDETLVDGYVFVSITGDPKCPSILGGEVTLVEGEDITCTITNDDVAPTITLVKNVINDNGGDAGADDFGISVGGVIVNSGDLYTVTANTPYAIDEVGLEGYGFVSITGDPKCPTVLGGEVTLGEGEQLTCTITNDDIAPTITLIKDPTNDSGGTAQPDDFDLTVGGVVVSSGVPHAVDANTPYAIDETLVEGYEFVSITGDAKCPSVLGGEVILDEGEEITCTITNDDLPQETDSYVFLPYLQKP